MKKTTAQEMQLLIAMFEGRSVSLGEATKIAKEVRRRNKILIQEFGLTGKEIKVLLFNKEKLKQFASKLQEEWDVRVENRINGIKATALKKMRDPSKTHRL
jgi:ribosomal protein L13